MAYRTWDTEADFKAAYRMNGEPDGYGQRPRVTLNYHRYVLQPIMAKRAQLFDRYVGGAATVRLCIVGGGFGWFAEELMKLGYANIAVTDTSPYVQSAKVETEEADVRAAIERVGLDPDIGEGAGLLARLNTGVRSTIEIMAEDVSLPEGRTAVQRELGGVPDVVLTESVLEGYTDREAVTFNEAVLQFGSRELIHAIWPGRGAVSTEYNWKSIADWKALLPSVKIAHIKTWEVV